MKTRGGKATRRSSRLNPTEKEASEPEAMEGDALETEAMEGDALESEARNSEPAVGKKTRNRKRKKHIEEDSEEDREPVSGDDCEVVGDEDYDEMVREDELLALAIVPQQYCEPDGAEFDGGGVEDKDEGGIGVEEQNCDDFEAEFGADAIDDRDDRDDRDDNGEAESDADSGDDIWDDERIPDPLSYSDDEEEPGVEEAGVAREDPDVILSLGKMFNGPDDFRNAVLRYSLKTRYDVTLYKSQSLRVGAKCSATDVKCPWRCYCSYDKKKHKMKIKIYVNEHCCVRSGYSKMLKQGTIAWLYRDRLRKNPKITKEQMVFEIKREYNLEVTDGQCSKAKTMILREKKATHEEHFARIWDYQAQIFKTNEGTTFEIETTPGPTIGSLQRFFRCFICFNSQKESWKNTCRPIIGIDGAFLRWDVKGHLVAAVGRDGDNRIVPIAWAVVEIENDDNWDWFLRKLSKELNLKDGKGLAILSDKQSGLVKAISEVVPQAEHRLCAKHIMDNWKKHSHDMELQRIFWRIARSYTEGEFNGHMQEMRSYNPSAYDSLLRTNPRTWSRAFFRIGTCCNDNLNNLSESFNKTIREARRKPLLDMLEDIRRQCMVRNQKRYVVATKLKTRFTKRAHAEIEKMIAGSQLCERWLARHNRHEIKLGDVNVCVDMNERTCSCRKWQMTGIPCVHAASVIIGKKEKVEDYVAEWYTTRMWELTYTDGIGPVPGKQDWPRVNRLGVLPPPWRRGNPGRPPNHARRRSQFETAASSSNPTKLSRVNQVVTCSNCKQEGHNKSGCKNQRVPSPPKRGRGRPRKEHEPRVILFGHGQPLQREPSQGAPSQPSHVPAMAPSQPLQRGRSHLRGSQRGGGSQRGRGSQRGGGSHIGGGSQTGRGSQTGGGSQTGSWEPWFQCSS